MTQLSYAGGQITGSRSFHLRQITREFIDVHAGRIHDFGPLGRHTAGDLLEQLRDMKKAESDRALHSLLVLGHAGDALAERVVLQAMLPKAAALGRTCAGLRPLSPQEAERTALGAMWESIRTYPIRRTNSVAGNLALNALSIITASYPAAAPKGFEEEARETSEIEEALNRDVATDDEPSWGDSSFHDLVTVLRWAIDTGALTRDEVAILARVDLAEAEERADLADQLGITRNALRMRVSRIRTKLMDAVREHITAHGRW